MVTPRKCRADRRDCITFTAGLAAAILLAGGARSWAVGQFVSGVNVMEVYARVADRRGDPLTGLTGADFEVRENGETQAIASFSEGQFPLAVALALGAARTLLGELRPEDESMVVAIGSEVDVVAPLSTDRRVQLAALGRLDAFGTTGLCRQIQQSDASDAC